MNGTDEVFALATAHGCAWVTAAFAPMDHAVTSDVHAAALETGAATFIGVCGAIFTPAAMITAPKPWCPICVAWLRARAHEQSQRQPATLPGARHHRARRWRRWFGFSTTRLDTRGYGAGFAVGTGRRAALVSTAHHPTECDSLSFLAVARAPWRLINIGVLLWAS